MKCTAYIYQTNNSEVALPRSSHGISFYKGKLYVHGGEHVARTPISSDVLSVSLLQGQEGQAEETPRLLDFKVETVSGDIPPPRVGHAQVRVKNQLYIFGGRQGIHMDEAPMNDLYALDLDTMIWKEIKTTGSIPCSRSFHCIAAGSEEGGAIYVFGGCGESGRLSDVYRLNLNDMTWENIIATDHIKGRGGANFFTSPCANVSGSSKGDTLYVIAGFIGAETNDVYSFDPSPSGSDTTTATSSWKEEIKASGNFRPRSVCAHCNVQWKGKEYLAVFGGEVSPSDKGHEGAGGFANDLLLFPIDSSSGGLEEPISVPLTVDAKDGGDSMIVPRGWTMMCQDDSVEGRLVVFGGLSGSDEEPTRLNDVIVMQLSD